MKPPRITEVAEVAIGQRYIVPCILTCVMGGGRRAWVPVMPPAHEDQEIIGFPHRHYHFDVRFFDENLVRRFAQRGGTWKGHPRPAAILARVQFAGDNPPLEWRTMRCERQMPDTLARSMASWFAALEDAYAKHQLKPDCRVCPHRGVALNGLPVRENVVICPAHGLAWNVQTGSLVRRGKDSSS